MSIKTDKNIKWIDVAKFFAIFGVLMAYYENSIF